MADDGRAGRRPELRHPGVRQDRLPPRRRHLRPGGQPAWSPCATATSSAPAAWPPSTAARPSPATRRCSPGPSWTRCASAPPRAPRPPAASQAARAGKHVIVEKPMALTLADADALEDACREAGVKLTVVLQNRYNAAMRRLREAVDAGKLGKLLLATVTVRWYRPQEYYSGDDWHGTCAMDGGALMNQAIHHIDALQWMMGEPESAFAYTAHPGPPDRGRGRGGGGGALCRRHPGLHRGLHHHLPGQHRGIPGRLRGARLGEDRGQLPGPHLLLEGGGRAGARGGDPAPPGAGPAPQPLPLPRLVLEDMVRAIREDRRAGHQRARGAQVPGPGAGPVRVLPAGLRGEGAAIWAIWPELEDS